jgi:Cu(I)/Ag(I) efflux system membrane fusion protein
MDLIPVASAAHGTKDAIFIAPEKLQELGATVVVVVKKVVNGADSLSVPLSAVLPTGNSYLTFVYLNSGYIAPREIKIGAQSSDSCQVLSGLREGDRVISGGLFLIDAECRNQGVLTTWGDNT